MKKKDSFIELQSNITDSFSLDGTDAIVNYFQVLIEVSKGAKIRNRYNQVPHQVRFYSVIS